MDYQHLGRSGLRVSRLCLGTMNFGILCRSLLIRPQSRPNDFVATVTCHSGVGLLFVGLVTTDQPGAFEIMDTALAMGINFVDTADVYGGPQSPDMEKGYGVSEEIIGRWLSQGGGRRERIVLATKVYQPMDTGPNDRRLSAYHIRRACDESLRRLRTDHIDLYQMHHVDRSTPWEEIWQAMDQLVREGKVTYVGSSNFAGWDIATAQNAATARNVLGLVSEQSLYNLASRTVELEVIPALRHYGVGLIPWSPLAGGLLAGVLRKANEGRRAGEQMQQQIEQRRSQLERYEALCAELGELPADVALAWLLRNPVVTATIVGPRTTEQLSRSRRALEISLSEETLRELDDIWPGPGGEAPQAYAW
jgi:aryl-alcohol dehydrogenase-like predicted oxidoreductase